MIKIQYYKEEILKPESSGKEFILSNRLETYCSTTITGLNTRKYHGLLVTPQHQLDGERFILLSSLDETVIQDENDFKLATHKYPGSYYPEGYKFIEQFSYLKTPEWLFKINDIILKKELLLVSDVERVLLRYTVMEADEPFKLMLEPLLAFRKIHTLTRSNLAANKKFERIENGVKFKLYGGFNNLCIQLSRKVEYVPVPDWFYNIEYPLEQERGYSYQEDLYRPGYFKLRLKKGDAFVISAGLEEVGTRTLNPLFNKEFKSRKELNSMDTMLESAALQLLVYSPRSASVIAGLPWFGQWGRDTFIALPGLTLSTGHPELFNLVIKEMLKRLKEGLFPNTGNSYNSADAPLWFFWSLQQYAAYTGSSRQLWKHYGARMKSILENYRIGTLYNIHCEHNGLLYVGAQGNAVTWMDAVVNGKPVTPRTGCPVEINALWYNAVCFALECAKHSKDNEFIFSWENLPSQIESSFNKAFKSPDKEYLADCVSGDFSKGDVFIQDWTLRPNQIFALSLPYSLVNIKEAKVILETINEKLLTPRGLRTLTKDDPNYKGKYRGDHNTRDIAYHQGTVWTWLTGHFAEAYLKVYGDEGLPFVQSIYDNFASALTEYGLGTIAEIYDGDEPYKANGAPSQAWSVAELLRIRDMLKGIYKITPVQKKHELETVVF